MSQAKAAAARANGARSAQNATKHGLNSSVVVLAHESQDEYAELLADYLVRFQPAGSAEVDLVHEIAANRWRMRRIVRMESAIFDAQMDRLEQASPGLAPSTIELQAFEALAQNSKSLNMLGRYENRLRRSYEKALKELREPQSKRQEQNEPNEEPAPASRLLSPASCLLPPVSYPLPSASCPGVQYEGGDHSGANDCR